MKSECSYLEEVKSSKESNEEEPEPQEDEDLLVEKINWQHTLDSPSEKKKVTFGTCICFC